MFLFIEPLVNSRPRISVLLTGLREFLFGVICGGVDGAPAVQP